MTTPAQEGYEDGIMRRTATHTYLRQSALERQYMAGFKRGRERRAWLEARSQERVEHVVWNNGPSDWHWEVLVEKNTYAQGSAKTERAAYQACEDANMERVNQKETHVNSKC